MLTYPLINLGHTIDHFTMLKNYTAKVIPGAYISDHRMITLDTNISKPKPKTEIKYVCNLMDNKIQEFIEEFNNNT